MRDVTDRALDTASRRVRPTPTSGSSGGSKRASPIKTRPRRRRRVGRERGLRRPRPGRWRVGLRQQSHILGTAEADRVAAEAVRIARASATALRDPTRARRSAAGPRHATRPRSRRTRSRSRSRRKIARPARRRPGRRRGQGDRLHRVDLRRPARVEDLRGDRRQLHRAGHHPRRRRRSRPTPSMATSTSAGATRIRAAAGAPAATRSSATLELAGTGRAARRGGRRTPDAPRNARPAGSRSSSTPASSTCRSTSRAAIPTELDRVFGTEASYAGTSFLTTDKLDEGFRYGSDLVDIVADATAPGGMGTFGWDDEGVAAQAVPLVKDGIFVGYLSSRETAPRIGPPERRRDAGRRLEPDPAHPDDQHQPAAQARHEPRRHRRRHRRRAVPRLEPLVVDRRPPAQLPVRHRGRLRDQGRQ